MCFIFTPQHSSSLATVQFLDCQEALILGVALGSLRLHASCSVEFTFRDSLAFLPSIQPVYHESCVMNTG